MKWNFKRDIVGVTASHPDNIALNKPCEKLLATVFQRGRRTTRRTATTNVKDGLQGKNTSCPLFFGVVFFAQFVFLQNSGQTRMDIVQHGHYGQFAMRYFFT